MNPCCLCFDHWILVIGMYLQFGIWYLEFSLKVEISLSHVRIPHCNGIHYELWNIEVYHIRIPFSYNKICAQRKI
jgi:hypothetical protein